MCATVSATSVLAAAAHVARQGIVWKKNAEAGSRLEESGIGDRLKYRPVVSRGSWLMATMPRRTHATAGFRPSFRLSIAAAALCLGHFFTGPAVANVKVPDYSKFERKMEAAKPSERLSPSEPQPARARQGCDLWSSPNLLSADAELAAAVLGTSAPSLSEVRLDSVSRWSFLSDRSETAYHELLSTLEGVDAISDIVQVAEGVSAGAAACPLFVSVTRADEEQTFWRFAPDDE